jgi:hypothetical protein
MSQISDDDFLAYAAQAEKADKERKERKGSGGGANFEELSWTGLEPNRMKIIRVTGAIPDTPHADKFSPHIVQIGRIKGDNGKEFRSVLPDRDKSPDHLIWKIITRVNEVTYINRKRVSVNETRHKDIFDLINFNGIPEGDLKRKYSRGWVGRNVIVMNVIDREQMDWHSANKHTLLLSRNINEGSDGRVFADEGVPVYGFFNVIVSTLFKHYGNWEGYDIGVVRTGSTESPYRLYNASKYALADMPEIPADLKPLVSQAKSLTAEEASWARYDLDKIFAPTTYTKYYNNLKVAIQTIDARLGTGYFKELEFEVEKERAARDAAKANGETFESEEPQATGNQTTVPKDIPASTPPVAPPRTRAAAPTPAASNGLEPEKIAALKGWSKLEPSQRAQILDVKLKNGLVDSITYNTEDVVACPHCRISSPEPFPACPGCGTVWADDATA